MQFEQTLDSQVLQSLLNPFATYQTRKCDSFVQKKRIILLAGPTGVGKTQISLMICRALGGEVVSADSMQVYRGMDIGTAKVTPEERGNIRHHLIDSRDLDERFNVIDFYHEATQAFREILARDHVPIVVGGTGFYIHSLIYGPPQGPPSQPTIRMGLEEKMKNTDPLELYEELKRFDPEYAATITFRDRQKIIRALEIIAITHQKVSSFERSNCFSNEYDFRCWFLYMPKEILYPRVEQRCERMLADGFVNEVSSLAKQGLKQNISASQAIGYRQCLDFLNTQQTSQDLATFVTHFKQATRRYVKRQFTWFRKEPSFHWVNIAREGVDRAIELILQDYERNH